MPTALAHTYVDGMVNDINNHYLPYTAEVVYHIIEGMDDEAKVIFTTPELVKLEIIFSNSAKASNDLPKVISLPDASIDINRVFMNFFNAMNIICS